MHIRPATTEDYPLIRQVARITWRDTYSEVISPRNQREFLRQAYSDRLQAARHQRPGSRLVVAEVDERLVGYASVLERSTEAAELTSLYVLPGYQGRGIGTALLEHHLAELAAREIKALVLSVLRENQRARRFYERHGFEIVEEQTVPLGSQEIVEVVYARRVKSYE